MQPGMQPGELCSSHTFARVPPLRAARCLRIRACAHERTRAVRVFKWWTAHSATYTQSSLLFAPLMSKPAVLVEYSAMPLRSETIDADILSRTKAQVCS
eukprot:scaffold125892_cov57-Phaeocystis_antarctica.AAC.3